MADIKQGLTSCKKKSFTALVAVVGDGSVECCTSKGILGIDVQSFWPLKQGIHQLNVVVNGRLLQQPTWILLIRIMIRHRWGKIIF